MQRWPRRGRLQQLGSGQGELEAGAVGRAWSCAAWKQREWRSDTHGKKRKEGEVRPSDRAERAHGARSGSGPEPELSARVKRGRAAREQGKGREREREREVAVGWD
jgi:hypothetical protein